MEQLEATLAKGVSDGKIPFAVVEASSRDGKFNYTHLTGTADPEHKEPIREDALFQLASCTKLLTAISVLQIVEKGLVGLDDDVAGILPELAAQKILQGFDEQDKPILVERKNTITLRTLLTHSSGAAYEAFTPQLQKYRAHIGVAAKPGSTIVTKFDLPLLFEPGTAWAYSCGLDWAGLLLERLTSVTLDVWMQKHIFDPLSVPASEFTFFPSADVASRVACAHLRGADGVLVPTPGTMYFNQGAVAAFGGHGSYSTMRAYHAVLSSLVRATPDEPSVLLSPASLETLFAPTLTPASRSALVLLGTQPIFQFFVGHFPSGVEFDYAPGGIVQSADATGYGRRKQGVMTWGGLANTFWSIDRAAGVVIAFGTQVLPVGDGPVKEMITAVEEAVYRAAGVVV